MVVVQVGPRGTGTEKDDLPSHQLTTLHGHFKPAPQMMTGLECFQSTVPPLAKMLIDVS